MELTNEFRVGVPVEHAWAVLTDIERIAPCMPGAQLQEVEGDEYRGVIKVKVGPITAQYKGRATFVERDVAAKRVVLRAEGRETRGQGNANATITATLVPDGDGTRVSVVTDLGITGKVAQFGRGVLGDVSAKLLDQFVSCLEADVLAAPAGPAPDSDPAPDSEPLPTHSESSQATSESSQATQSEPVPVAAPPSASPPPVDLLQAAGSSVARRLVAPAVAVLAALWLLARRRRRRR